MPSAPPRSPRGRAGESHEGPFQDVWNSSGKGNHDGPSWGWESTDFSFSCSRITTRQETSQPAREGAAGRAAATLSLGIRFGLRLVFPSAGLFL